MTNAAVQDFNITDKKFSIIGLGLIGGSFAKALHERLNVSDIIAVTRNSASINQALLDGNISRGFNEINEYVFDSDIIIICTPVKTAIEYINKLAGKVKPGCIITDVGSTKGEIINHVNSMPVPPCFIGGHPMAGTEKTGYSSSFVHLFENAYYILTPSKGSGKDQMDSMTRLVKGIGAIPVILDADEHDTITAGISHIPHIIASALVNMVQELDSDDHKMQMLAAGGFKDLTRIASSSPEMWENIILSNSNKITSVLNIYIKILKLFGKYIKSGRRNNTGKKIYSFFENARNYRNLFSYAKKGAINPEYEIMVDVVDKPGIIGEIATILGRNGINIKNINVSNSREFEQGCLKITLPDYKSVNIAFDLLNNTGYKVFNNG